MPRFRKKPVVIEAVQWTGDNIDEVFAFTGQHSDAPAVTIQDGHISIVTREGTMRGEKGDWIIRGVQEELYPCKPDIFDSTYEAMEDADA